MHKQDRELAEAELVARIEPWLAHMRWRPGFEEWRKQRIEQEVHQQEALQLLEQGLELTVRGRRSGGGEQDVYLLDVGCGMGGFAVAAMLGGMHVVALDYHLDYAQITALRARRHDLKLPVFVSAGEAIPLPAAEFDVVTCWDVLEHVQSPAGLLAELARMLLPGGVLLLTAINRFAFRDPHYHLPLINWLPRPVAETLIFVLGRRKGGAFRDRQRLSDMHYFTWEELEHLATRHGFRLYDLDERRVMQGDVGPRRRWRRFLARYAQRQILPVYHVYRGWWQSTWRVALLKTEG